MAEPERCGRKRRDGQPCQRPIVEFADVCLGHGGASPQVQRAAHRRRLESAWIDAMLAWEAGRGTEAEFDLLCAVTAAQRALERFEAKLAELSWLRSELRRLRAAWSSTITAERDRPAVNGRPGGPEGSESRSTLRPETVNVPGDATQALGAAERFVRPSVNRGRGGTTQRSPFV